MNDRILKALKGEPVDRTPVWLMRQAGRSLPRYNEMRAADPRGMFELLRDAEASAEITLLPLEYYPLDAVVLYNDIATPYVGAGLEVTLQKGVGPVVDRPVETGADVDRLEPFDPREALGFTMDAIRILRERSPVPVLGFVAAPFTLASYLVRTPKSRDLRELKTFMREEPEAWHRLGRFWSEHLAEYSVAQWEAGASAIQVFDSWAGVLSVDDYRSFALPHTRDLIARLEERGIPTINFFTGNPALLPMVAEAGGRCVSVDWRIPLDEAWSIIGSDRSIQGNLDPTLLMASESVAVEGARDVLRRAGGRPGHIFNLGHGILPETDHRTIAAVVDAVHRFSSNGAP